MKDKDDIKNISTEGIFYVSKIYIYKGIVDGGNLFVPRDDEYVLFKPIVINSEVMYINILNDEKYKFFDDENLEVGDLIIEEFMPMMFFKKYISKNQIKDRLKSYDLMLEMSVVNAADIIGQSLLRR